MADSSQTTRNRSATVSTSPGKETIDWVKAPIDFAGNPLVISTHASPVIEDDQATDTSDPQVAGTSDGSCGGLLSRVRRWFPSKPTHDLPDEKMVERLSTLSDAKPIRSTSSATLPDAPANYIDRYIQATTPILTKRRRSEPYASPVLKLASLVVGGEQADPGKCMRRSIHSLTSPWFRRVSRCSPLHHPLHPSIPLIRRPLSPHREHASLHLP